MELRAEREPDGPPRPKRGFARLKALRARRPAGEGGPADPPARVSISTALMASFGAIVVIGMGAVLAIGMWGATENTGRLLADKAELATGGLVQALRQHLEPVRDGSVYLAGLIADGEVDANDPVQLADYMIGAMAATPQVLGMALFTPSFKVLRVGRSSGQNGIDIRDVADVARFRNAVEEAARRDGPFWGPPVWSPETRSTLVNLRTPIRRDGRFIGMLVSTVTVAELSRFLGAVGRAELPDGFILYGTDHVLAHRSTAAGAFAHSADVPLPSRQTSGDPVLAGLWGAHSEKLQLLRPNGRLEGQVVMVDGQPYSVIYQRVEGLADRPLIVGAYVRPGSSQHAELLRLRTTEGIGLAVLALGLVAALVLGRGLSRPIVALAAATRRVGALELADVKPVPGSRLRELDDAARAFNGMSGALRHFETYVPRKLVTRLMELGHDAEIASEEREVTVMFTDIVHFTALAETLGAAETAGLLNEHFSLLARCIEAAGGTVDKYIGDSVMAFWGPPFGAGDHVEKACAAALAIRRALGGANAFRRARGLEPVRIRVGLHAGPAIVGNIGAPGRINYTLVGDTVNTAQRLEQLGKEVETGEADGDATIVISDTVAARLDAEVARRPLGERVLPGLSRGIAAYAL